MVGPLGFPSLLVNGMAKRNVSDVMQRMIFFAALEIDDFDRYVLLKRTIFVGGALRSALPLGMTADTTEFMVLLHSRF
jgi:sugar (pentulose or hexulose) kinase